MRKVFVGALCVLLLCVGAAQAQKSIAENPDQAMEQMLFFRLVQQANLDSGSLAEVLDGYKLYHTAMDPMMENREKLSNEIKEAVSTNKGGYELKDKLSSLMSLDQKIFDANQQAIKEAGTLVNPVVQAQLYLLIYNRDAMIAEARASLACACTTSLAEAAPAAAKAAAPAAEAAPAAVKEAAPEEVILQGVKAFTEKMVAQDVKGVMALVSDKFTNIEYGDKAGLQDFIQNAADAGYLTGLEVGMKGASVKLDGDKATVQPIEINGSFGGASLALQLGKVDGAWKLTGLNIEGL